jgi:hypothetical protein
MFSVLKYKSLKTLNVIVTFLMEPLLKEIALGKSEWQTLNRLRV